MMACYCVTIALYGIAYVKKVPKLTGLYWASVALLTVSFLYKAALAR